MQAGPSCYVSVSELYSTDEVELLLDEIRELEPTSCRGEDVQDFEIAGSGAEAGGGGAGGRSPVGTEHSWDSHAHYTRDPPPLPRPLAPLYCRLSYCLTFRGAATLLLVICSCCACACTWAGVGLRAGALPLPGRVRLLQLGALSSVLLHTALLLMHVTRLALLLPIDWTTLCIACSVWSGVSLATGGALSLHAVLAAPDYRWAPPHLAHLLLAAAGLGLCGATVAGALAGQALAAWYGRRRRRRAPGSTLRSPTTGSLRAAYRAVPTAPPPPPSQPPLPSTSRDDPL